MEFIGWKEDEWSLVSRDDVDVLRSFQVEEQGIS
jgi:hypothetical protein